jgi:hypothetical protein
MWLSMRILELSVVLLMILWRIIGSIVGIIRCSGTISKNIIVISIVKITLIPTTMPNTNIINHL